MIDDALIEAIVKIGNLKKVIEVCEPQVCFSMDLQGWMVKRTLKAQELLQEEWDNEIQRSKQSDNRNNERGRSESIRKIPKK